MDATEATFHRRDSWVARLARATGLVALTLVGGADLLRRHDIARPAR